MKNKIFTIIFIIVLCLSKTEGMAMAKTNEIQLPQPVTKGNVSLEEAIAKRRSQREFSKRDLSLDQIGQLLWASQGITASKFGFNFRSAPSAGALYPIEIYLASKDGLFHYMPEGHKLEIQGKNDLRRSLADAAWGQSAVKQAAIDIVICAVYSRVTGKYGNRGTRYVAMEAGHVAQNIHLEAVALGLGSVPIGAFSDEAVKRVLNLPQDHEPLYIIPVGYPK